MAGNNTTDNYQKLEKRISKLEKQVSEGNTPQKKIVKISKKMLTITEAAEFLGLEVSGVHMLTHKKLIPYYKPNGKTIYFDPKELVAWQKRGRQAPVYEAKKEKESQEVDSK